MDVLAVPRNLQHGRFEHSPEEWEAHRTHIKSLYIEEQKKLSDVRRRMEVDHGFYATNKQYKDWIEKWKLRKNLKAKEKTILLLKYKYRKRQNKDTTFEMNGEVIPIEKINRIGKGQKVKDIRSPSMTPPAKTPPCVNYRTPREGSPGSQLAITIQSNIDSRLDLEPQEQQEQILNVLEPELSKKCCKATEHISSLADQASQSQIALVTPKSHRSLLQPEKLDKHPDPDPILLPSVLHSTGNFSWSSLELREPHNDDNSTHSTGTGSVLGSFKRSIKAITHKGKSESPPNSPIWSEWIRPEYLEPSQLMYGRASFAKEALPRWAANTQIEMGFITAGLAAYNPYSQGSVEVD